MINIEYQTTVLQAIIAATKRAAALVYNRTYQDDPLVT